MSRSSTSARICVAIALSALALLAAGGAARAGNLSVEAGAKFAGNYGLKATVGTCASMDSEIVSDPTITGPATYEACDTLTTSGTVNVASGLATFRSGRTIGLSNGFSVASGATFRAEIAPGLFRPAYVEDDSPAAEKVYRAQFYARFDGLTVGDGTSFDHFDVLRADGTAALRVRFKRNGAMMENRLFVEARLDDGSFASNEGFTEVAVPAGWHPIEVVWKAATAPGQNDGSVEVILDGISNLVLSGLDNDQVSAETVRWGAVAAIDPSVTGFMELDEFTSSRTP